MILYSIETSRGPQLWPTLKEALLEARAEANTTGMDVTVSRITTVAITREVMCNVINGWGGYSAEEAVIRTVKPQKVKP